MACLLATLLWAGSSRLASAELTFPVPPGSSGEPEVSLNDQSRPAAEPPVQESAEPAVEEAAEPAVRKKAKPAVREEAEPLLRVAAEPAVRKESEAGEPVWAGEAGAAEGEEEPILPGVRAAPPAATAEEEPPEVLPDGLLDRLTDDLSGFDFLPDWTTADATAAEPPGLAGIPDMFGDTFFGSPRLFYSGNGTRSPAVDAAMVDLPIAGGSSRTKIGENNKALPTSRVYFLYDYFHNAFQSTAAGRTAANDFFVTSNDNSLDRYVIGWEQSLFCGNASVEVRMPLAGRHTFDFAQPPLEPAGTLQVRDGQVGNLAVILKQLLHADCRSAFSWGVGIGAPTGSNATAIIDDQRFRIDNDAFYVSPFLALLHQPAGRLFFNGFLQLDVPISGNRVRVQDLQTGSMRRLGYWNDQILLHLDATAGWWVYENPCASFLRGLAPLLELHYVTSRLQAADVISDGNSRGYSAYSSDGSYSVSSSTEQLDLFTATIALHVELACRTKLRIGGVLPLVDDSNRLFDAEFGFQISHDY